jgi:hypothetical protein
LSMNCRPLCIFLLPHRVNSISGVAFFKELFCGRSWISSGRVGIMHAWYHSLSRPSNNSKECNRNLKTFTPFKVNGYQFLDGDELSLNKELVHC